MGISREIELEGWNKELSEKIKRLELENRQLKLFKENALRTLEEDGVMVGKLRKALEDIQFFSDPMGGTSNMGIYNIAYTALKK